jgi:hypothetical protein
VYIAAVWDVLTIAEVLTTIADMQATIAEVLTTITTTQVAIAAELA